MPDPSLKAPLGKLADTTARALASDLESHRRAEESALDPIADPLRIEPDRAIITTAEIVAALKAGAARVDVVGARGGAFGHLVAAILRDTSRPVVVVTPDVDRARLLVSDLEFFTSEPRVRAPKDASDKPRATAASDADADADISAEDAEDLALGDVLMLAPPEASPYAEVSPDRRGALARLATLSHLARRASEAPGKRAFSVLVIAAPALVRRVVPRAVVEAHTEHVVAEEELDRDRFLARLTESGYLRVPVVEDPGTFAVRGALLDVWAPSSPRPARIELYGELVLSIKTFDPDKQRTLASLPALHLPPAREAVLTEDAIELAKIRVSELCDSVNLPTSKARAKVEDVAMGRAFFGAEGFLPAYYESLEPVWRYLPADALFVLDDPTGVAEAIRDEHARAARDEAEKQDSPHFASAAHYVSEGDVASRLSGAQLVLAHRVAIVGGAADDDADTPALRPIERAPEETPTLGTHDQSELAIAIKQARSTRGKRGALEPLVRRLAVWREAGLRTILTARATTQAERLVSLLRGHDVTTRGRLAHFDARWLRDADFGRNAVEVCVGSLSQGAILPNERLALVTEEEVFGARAKRRAPRAQNAKDAARPFVEDLRALAVGDLVVHAEHGIGKYLGLEHREILGPAMVDADGKLHQPKTKVDLIVVEYGGGDRLFLPVYRLNQIQKYTGGEGTAAQAKLDKLGGTTFAKSKSRVEKAVKQMADELLRLYAERQAMEGDALPTRHDGDEYREFEATFPFEETQDQSKAIEDVLDDLEKPRPMDRLVCGDVGFGKTEVAIRAAFRAASSGRQVAVLCPTTVLAQQHFLTFSQRLAEYPITIAPMSRFQDEKEQRETIRRLKEGKLDIVIGTHRLLSKDVHFKDLGLLVVDEEQRFGVTHKERIKQLKTKVHVLTLTATPIPRTLQMAVSGLRDLSLITTPPVDRRAIRTLVMRWDDAVVREAINREMQRGGQVFYVYNRVGPSASGGGGIYEKAQRVQELVPHARVGVAHGQMGEKELEQAMLDFVEGRFDVLCSTAIVESGLDIPRANTILVDRADLFGLSQLYQLRGRVGRSKERAYCYLIVPPQAALTDEARARIEALEKHTELGSGFKIASLDLEIRGAGDLLGGEQSGNVAQVGFEMFCNMLDEAVARLRAELSGGDVEFVQEIDPELSFDVEAFLPDDYLSDVGVRLGLYKRLAGAPSSDRGGDEWVNEIAAEMEDRFGPPPEHAARFIRVMRLKTELRSLRALGCEAVQDRVTLHLREDTPIDPVKLMKVIAKKASPWKLTPERRLTRRYEPGETRDGIEATEKLVSELGAFMKEVG